MDGMMGGMHGMTWVYLLVGVALIVVLISLSVFLIRRSRPPAK